MSGLLFYDIFKVENADPEGKKYDKRVCTPLICCTFFSFKYVHLFFLDGKMYDRGMSELHYVWMLGICKDVCVEERDRKENNISII